MIRFDSSRALPFVDAKVLQNLASSAVHAHDLLLTRTGPGSDCLGWRSILEDPTRIPLDVIESVAERVQSEADVLVCIGIGGSYLGAEAVIEALTPASDGSRTKVYFAGHHLGANYLNRLLAQLEGKSVFLNVISKSGTTLEPAISFRIVRKWLEERFDDAARRIIVTTDPVEGALNRMQRRSGYEKFEIPGDVGGRFSVLTPVGLLPIACAGIDVRALVDGGVRAADALTSAKDNEAISYAVLRTALLTEGYTTELLAAFDPRFRGLQAWWQQLYGESEGKDRKGLYPDTVGYTTDLHSLGQYVQDGRRCIFESFLMITEDDTPLEVPYSDDDSDKLNYLAGKTLHEINSIAYAATAEAHESGGVPNATLWLDRLSPESIGELIYFFEHAVAVSGYLLEVNPFDQPGVEAYKTNMFRLLGRP